MTTDDFKSPELPVSHMGMNKMLSAMGGRTNGCYANDPKCQTEAYEEHACPFASEIHDDETPCRCCDKCAYECAMDT